MFLRSLRISRGSTIVRDIPFNKGLNLIVDETSSGSSKESGNNVGKTTVLRLIDFCLGGEGKNIYVDPEFRGKSNTEIENFLKDNNVIVSLELTEDLEDQDSKKVLIERNFHQRSQKIQQINGETLNNPKFLAKLKELVFQSREEKPTFRQIIAKNIRDEKNRLINTVKVLHPTTSADEYEALFLFWLGLDLNSAQRKQKLLLQRKLEENLQRKLRKESTLAQVEQSLRVVDQSLEELSQKREQLGINAQHEEDIESLNRLRAKINLTTGEINRLELRRELIQESASELELETSSVNTEDVRLLYSSAKALIPDLQKSYEETLSFHNQMVAAKKAYITKELPSVDSEISTQRKSLQALLEKEKKLASKLNRNQALKEIEELMSRLNELHETKGRLEEKKRVWKTSIGTISDIDAELEKINKGIDSFDDLIQERAASFNKYFSELSNQLYGEQFVLSPDKTEKGYQLSISSISGNLGTGKKKGQIAAFDLAYIKFADENDIPCLHFILHDQIENIHDNQINSILTKIVNEVNCQYIVPVLRDKLPPEIDVDLFQVLRLSQSDKLFKIP